MQDDLRSGRDLGIRRLSLPETLADSLRERILQGEFHEGDQLRQEALAAEYRVSRMPVREALRQLEAAGLVELRTHRGAVVKTLPLDEIGELFDLRALLECDALERAVPLLSAEDLARANEVLGHLEEAYRRGDISAWGALNSAFHESLYRASGRPQTLAMIRALNTQTDRYIRLQLTASRAIERAEKDHREILSLCQARRTERVTVFLREHIERARGDLLALVARRRAA